MNWKGVAVYELMNDYEAKMRMKWIVPGGGNDGYPRAFDCALNDWLGSECGLDVPDEWPSERFVQLSPEDPLPLLSNIVVAYGVGLSGDWKQMESD